MQILGPLESSKCLNLLALKDDKFVIIELGIKSSIIQAVNNQVPIFFFRHFDKLLNTPLSELINAYKTITVSKSDILNIEVQSDNLIANKIVVFTEDKERSFAIPDRGKTNLYKQIVLGWYNQ